jgi:MFS family permease
VQVDAELGTGAPRIGAKGVFAAVLGNGLEFFDFTVYATFLDLIGQAFFPSANPLVSDLASAATFGVGFVARPLGGALLGAYGDRAGRKPAMTLSIGLMAVGSGLIAVTPGYATIGIWAPILLIAARLLQGFAVGGEVGPVTMFIIEAAPKGRRMLFASWQLASQNLGSMASGVIGVLLAISLSKASYNEWGWRVPFAIGVLIAPIGVYIRSRLVETLDRSQAPETRSTMRILSEVLRSNWTKLLLGLALISGGTITQYFLLTMTPYAIRTLHLPSSTAMLGSVTLGITGCLGALTGGFLADRWGVRLIAIAPRILFTLALFPVMTVLVGNPSATTLVFAVALLSVLHAASVAVVVILVPLGLSGRRPRNRTRDRLFARGRDLRWDGDLRRDLARRRDRQPACVDLLRDGRQYRHAARDSGGPGGGLWAERLAAAARPRCLKRRRAGAGLYFCVPAPYHCVKGLTRRKAATMFRALSAGRRACCIGRRVRYPTALNADDLIDEPISAPWGRICFARSRSRP